MLLYEDESYKIRGAVFSVYKTLGCKHKESIYQKALAIALSGNGLLAEKEKRLPVLFESKNVGTYIPDFLVNEKIIIELKAKSFTTKEDIHQFWQYLKSTDYKLGFLVNFGRPGGVQIIRRIYEVPRNSIKLPQISAWNSA